MLYGIVQDHVATLLDTARDRLEHGFGYPRFVEREFEKFLARGLLSSGAAGGSPLPPRARESEGTSPAAAAAP